MSKYTCHNSICAISISKAAFPVAMNCPVCQTPLEEKLDIIKLSPDDLALINSLPYVIAYPLKETLLQNDYEKRLHRLGYTFINFLKYLGLISISEFFNSDFKNRRIVDLFLSQLSEKPSTGKWNGFIRDCYAILQKEKIKLVFPEFYDFYVQIENKDKKFNISEEIIEDFGEVNYSKKNGLSSIGMLVNFRNKYLGHFTPINENKAKELWEFYYPIFQTLLVKLSKLPESSLYKKENGIVWKLASSVVTEENNLNQAIDEEKVWLADNKDRKLSMVPFFIIPSDFGNIKNETQLLVYESYTGSTIKFFSPESIVRETSGEILQRLNLLLREKQKETPFTPEAFTKQEFLKRIAEENKLLLDRLVREKKIIPDVYQHRNEMEIKLREWVGARASIFFIAAEAGSGKTNLLVEIQKQYAALELPSLLIRAGRMEKQSLKEEIAYLLNIDLVNGLENYSSIAGTQAQPAFILIDGLNEANNAENIWQELIYLSKIFETGSIKFVVTNRANTKADLDRYSINEIDNVLLYGENKDNETGLSAYSFWLTALDMQEMKGAWDTYATSDKSKFKPQFSFNDIATFDRALYNQINNPLILRIFLEIYNGKALPKKGTKHLRIWNDWFKAFSTDEQKFLKLLANAVWEKGDNELLLDDLLKHESLKSYLNSDNTKEPYDRLKNMGLISSYVKDLNRYLGFTVEGALLYLLAVQLQEQKPVIDLAAMQSLLKNGSKLKKSAIESFLCELAINGNLDLVTNLIDAGNDDLDLSIKPLLIYLKTFGAKASIEKVLETSTENDWKAFLKLDEQLNELQLHVLRKEFLIALMPQNKFKIKESVCIGLNAIAIFDNEDAINYLNKVDTKASIILEDADLLSQLGDCETKFGSYDKALEYFEKSLAIYLKTLGGEHPSVATSYNNIGSTWDDKDEYDKALEYYEKSLAIYLKTLGGEHPDVATSYNIIGLALDNKGESDKALEYYEKSLVIRLKTLGGEHPNVAVVYNNIGASWALRNKGEYDKALEYYEKSLPIYLKTLGGEHPDVATTYNNIGFAWMKKSEYDKALDYYEKCLAIELKTLGGEHPSVANSYNNIGLAWDSKGEYEKSLEFYVLSSQIRFKKLGASHNLTKTSIESAKDLAKELGKENELPEWMKNY